MLSQSVVVPETALAGSRSNPVVLAGRNAGMQFRLRLRPLQQALPKLLTENMALVLFTIILA